MEELTICMGSNCTHAYLAFWAEGVTYCSLNAYVGPRVSADNLTKRIFLFGRRDDLHPTKSALSRQSCSRSPLRPNRICLFDRGGCQDILQITGLGLHVTGLCPQRSIIYAIIRSASPDYDAMHQNFSIIMLEIIPAQRARQAYYQC